MKKRDFLKTAGILGVGVVLAPGFACSPKKEVAAAATAPGAIPPPFTEFTLPELGYATNALEPLIDARTMEIHHGKHHAAYVANLNKAIVAEPKLAGKTLEELCADVKNEETAVRNNAGGHWNHTKFWNWIQPGGAKSPNDNVLKAIEASFGTYEEFRTAFAEAAKSRFGSGWAWLSLDRDKKLFISTTPNQDNPLMKNLVEKGGTPILGIDVWEHAYYLKYENKRPDYIAAFMQIINWDYVGHQYLAGMK